MEYRSAARLSDVTLAVERADSETSIAPAASQSVEPSELAPPGGVWVVAYRAGCPVGCGGLQGVDVEATEVRRLFIDPTARGSGIARVLLARLEAQAAQLGYRRVRLTTGDAQPEALALFTSTGYAEIPAFTTGVFTRHWMEKRLEGSVGAIAYQVVRGSTSVESKKPNA